MSKRLTEQQKQEILRLYADGQSCRKIGEKLGINPVTAYHALKNNGVKLRTRGGIDQINPDEVSRLYLEEHLLCTKIANIFNVTPHTITAILESRGIPRNQRFHNLELVTDYFHEIDSYDKAYFLGFIYTDGCVNKKRPTLAITIKDSDAYILDTLRSKMHVDNPLSRSVRKSRKGNPVETKFQVTHQQIVDDLAQWNIVPRKTYTADLPTNLPKEMLPHFIRGLIDGDGWVTAGKLPAIGFCGNEQSVNAFSEILHQEIGVYPRVPTQSKTHLWLVTWARKRDVMAIGEYIYADKQDCYLERKYQAFLQILDMYRHDNSEVIRQIANRLSDTVERRD